MTRTIRLLTGCILVLTLVSLAQPAGAQIADSTGKASVSITPESETIGPDGTADVRLKIEIEEHWHIQANETKKGLIATKLEATAPDGARITNTSYPKPKQLSLEGFGTVDVFEGTVEVPATVQLPASSLTGDSVTITFQLTAQACDDKSCLAPGTWENDLTLPVSEEASSNASTRENGETNGTTSDRGSATKNENQETSTGTDNTKINFLIPASTPEKPPEDVLKELGLSVEGGAKSEFQKKMEQSLFIALAFAFFWGLVSSLSPCVYPMIPLTLSYFGAQGQTEEEDETESEGEPYLRVVGLALVYVLGVSLTFSVLGVIAAVVGVELGLALGNPWFVGFLIVLFVLLALSMMELFEIPVPSSLQGMGTGKPGVVGAFVMGILLGVIAAPCVGPFAAAILVFISGTGNVFIGFAGMFSFGLGLGMLFLALAIFGGYSSAFSTSTAWLKNMKIFWGFVLLAVTLYFVDLWMGLMGRGGSATWLIPLLTGAVATVFGFWFWSISQGDESKEKGGILALRATGKGIALLLLLIGSYYALGGIARSEFLFPAPGWLETNVASQKGKANVENFQAAVKKAKTQGKPIFIDFYADWCIPCAQMDRTVFSDPEVAEFMNENFVSIKLDCTSGSGWNTSLKADVFQSSAMPLYAFFDARGNYRPEASIEGKTDKQDFLKQARKVLNEN